MKNKEKALELDLFHDEKDCYNCSNLITNLCLICVDFEYYVLEQESK